MQQGQQLPRPAHRRNRIGSTTCIRLKPHTERLSFDPDPAPDPKWGDLNHLARRQITCENIAQDRLSKQSRAGAGMPIARPRIFLMKEQTFFEKSLRESYKALKTNSGQVSRTRKPSEELAIKCSNRLNESMSMSLNCRRKNSLVEPKQTIAGSGKPVKRLTLRRDTGRQQSVLETTSGCSTLEIESILFQVNALR